MQRALITGIAGQDGIYLARSLLAQGWQVVGTVRPGSEPSTRASIYLRGAEIVPTDHSEDSDLAVLVERVAPHEIYNLAAQSSVAESWRDPEGTFAVNVGPLEQLVRGALAVRERTGQDVRLLQASSAELGGGASASPYARAKASADELVRDARGGHGLHAVSAILYNHDSPLRGERFVTRKITRGVAEIALGRRSSLTLGNLDVRRDWGFAGDYVDAMQRLIRLPEPVDVEIGTGSEHRLADLLALAFGAAGLGDHAAYVTQDPDLLRPADADVLVADPEPAERLLDWRAVTTLPELVAHMVSVDLARLRTGTAEAECYLFRAA